QIGGLPVIGEQRERMVKALDAHEPLLLCAFFGEVQLPQRLVDPLPDNRVQFLHLLISEMSALEIRHLVAYFHGDHLGSGLHRSFGVVGPFLHTTPPFLPTIRLCPLALRTPLHFNVLPLGITASPPPCLSPPAHSPARPRSPPGRTAR